MLVRELRLTYLPRNDLPRVSYLTTPRACYEYFLPILEREPVEHFLVGCLSAKSCPLGFHVVAKGSVNSCHVMPAEVFKAALLANASAIVVAHNHPSGNPAPSIDDADLTRRLLAASQLLDIPLLDHIIVGDNRYFSFKEQGQL